MGKVRFDYLNYRKGEIIRKYDLLCWLDDRIEIVEAERFRAEYALHRAERNFLLKTFFKSGWETEIARRKSRLFWRDVELDALITLQEIVKKTEE